jgi:hypothetical protein
MPREKLQKDFKLKSAATQVLTAWQCEMYSCPPKVHQTRLQAMLCFAAWRLQERKFGCSGKVAILILWLSPHWHVSPPLASKVLGCGPEGVLVLVVSLATGSAARTAAFQLRCLCQLHLTLCKPVC